MECKTNFITLWILLQCHRPFQNMTPSRHNWCKFRMASIAHLCNYGKIVEHIILAEWLTVSSVITYLRCHCLAWERLQAEALCFYNVIAKMLIWTKILLLLPPQTEFDPVMGTWRRIGHCKHTHTHTPNTTLLFVLPESISTSISQINVQQ